MFWIFLAVIVATAVLVQYFKHRETQKTIRDAIERGQPLDAETVSKLVAAGQPAPPSPRALAFIGLLFVCLGIGLGALGYFSSGGKPEMIGQAAGLAVLLCMLGVPFLIGGLFASKRDGKGDK